MTQVPVGYFALILHTHLPFVLGHGRWPHGSDWLAEVTVGCYLPLLDTISSLASAGRAPHVTVDVSPVLAAQFAAPEFRTELEAFLRSRIQSARDDRVQFASAGEEHLAEMAGTWEQFYRARLEQFERLNGDLVGAFRRLGEAGAVELITCAATHGYLPLLGRDESIELQIRLAVASHERHFGRRPAGIWLPECAYRPRYEWTPPVGPQKGRVRVRRRGIEEFLADHALTYFFTDVHLARGGRPLSPYRDYFPALRALADVEGPIHLRDGAPYRPYAVASRGGRGSAVTFVRDPETTLQVWSRDAGYPGDGWYLEFHKRHFPGGLRYWRVTDPKSDLADKQPYHSPRAAERVRAHAEHFVGLVTHLLARFRDESGQPGIACSPYDTELFGHWWFEGPQWLHEVFQRLEQAGVAPADCSAYLATAPAIQPISLLEGSWGEGGDHRVWLNRDTEWTWERIYSAEEEFWMLARDYIGRPDPLLRRMLAQLARELLLLQASDWQFLITTWAARDYAESRFAEHYTNFSRLAALLQRAGTGEVPEPAAQEFLASREAQNFIFPDVLTHVEAACRVPAA